MFYLIQTFLVLIILVSEQKSKNKQKLVNEAFKKAFDKLINRLLLDKDYKKVSNTNINEIKKLISHYQIIKPNENSDGNQKIKVNVFFDKIRVRVFYLLNILYSDITDTSYIFSLLKQETNYFVYTKNYFYENWKTENTKNLIQYSLPVENIENLQTINLNEENIYKLNITDFFQEYEKENIVFSIIEIKEKSAEVFLNSRIVGKKVKKTISIEKNKNIDDGVFKKKIIEEINNVIEDLIKSQNLIDVRTPSFLNAEIKLSKKSNLIEFDKRLKKIDLIDAYYVQQLNKDYILIKIKYLGKIQKIIRKLNEQNINLKMTNGQWQINIS